jgi:hypothetical protein
LQNHEIIILKYYKEYLQKLEKMATTMTNKKYSLICKEDFYLGHLAINCMISLLVNQQYFNYSFNIANFLIPFLNYKRKNIRQLVAKCFQRIFKEDNFGKFSLSVNNL